MVVLGLGLGLRWTVARQAPPPPPTPSAVARRRRRRPPAAVLFSKECLHNFTVTKRPPILVIPNRPTPSQPLYLTNIDDQLGLRFHGNVLLFYRSPSDSSGIRSRKSDDPVPIIGEALAKLLVYYYPFAGRLRDADDKGKLIMDCTGEGVLFVEAHADISLEEFGDLSPPIPHAIDFINNAPASDTITDSPLLLCQVTRLRCGGFILGLHFNHCVTDGFGITQFVKALSEIAKGAASPTVPPVWNREILRPRANPRVKCPGLCEYYDFEDKYPEQMVPVPAPEEMKSKSVYFGPKEIGALKRQVKGVKHCTPFEVISACLWQSRTKAINIPADQDSTLLFWVNSHSRLRPLLPTGYYGNAIASAYAKTRARDLTNQPLSFAVELIKEGKRRVNEEYMRSMIDLAELNGRPLSAAHGSYIISQVSDIVPAVGGVDFGWGKTVYACPAYSPLSNLSYLMRASAKDSEGFRVLLSLPSTHMQIFEENIKKLTAGLA